MSVLQQQYTQLYELTSNAQCSEIVLNNMKRRYEDSVIKSRRTLSRIKTIRDLLEVLEKRDHISPENVAALGEIASRLGLRYDCQNHQNTPAVAPQNNYCSSSNPRTVNNRVLELPPIDLKERVHRKIVDRIGFSWRDFGRQLQVPQGRLDDLELRYPSSSIERTYEILRFHDELYVNNRSRWKTKLLNALVDSRRKDIKLEVEQIFDDHNLF